MQKHTLDDNEGLVSITWGGRELFVDSRKTVRQLAEIDKKHQTGPETYNDLARWEAQARFVDELRGDPPGTCSQAIAELVYACITQAATEFGEAAKKKLFPSLGSVTGTGADPTPAASTNGNWTPGLPTLSAATPSACCDSATSPAGS